MIILNNNFFSELAKNESRYVKEKMYFFKQILPSISELVNRGVIDEFKVNLVENPMDEPDFFEFKKTIDIDGYIEFNGVEYRDKQYYTAIKVVYDEDGVKKQKIEENWAELLPVLSDKKFKYLQEVLLEFFERLNFTYIKGAERAFFENGRFNDILGIIKRDKTNRTTTYELDYTKDSDGAITRYFYDCCKCNK